MYQRREEHVKLFESAFWIQARGHGAFDRRPAKPNEPAYESQHFESYALASKGRAAKRLSLFPLLWYASRACKLIANKLTTSTGHGGQTKDLDGDEDDGYDEVIYPVDFRTAGHIVDDDMHAIMYGYPLARIDDR